MNLWLKFLLVLFCSLVFSAKGSAQPLILNGEEFCKPENRCGSLCCADTDCCSSEGHCCKECIDTEACLKAGNFLENIDGCYVCIENPNACKKECLATGMTGETTTKCACICDIHRGFKSVAVNEECVCRDGFQKLIHEDRCVECFTDNDCKGDCMVCSSKNTCVSGSCCKKENTPCDKQNDRCCGDLYCSERSFCCTYPEMKKCSSNQELIIPPNGCAYCKDLPFRKEVPKQQEPLPKTPPLPETKPQPKPEKVQPSRTSNSWECRGPLLKENGITYSGKHIIPTDELIFLFFDKEGDKLFFSYLDTGPSIHISKHGVAHWNTHDQEKSHVLREITLPYGYCVDTDSVKGKSYGHGCTTMDFSGTNNSISKCYYGHVQKPVVEWEFTIYPLKDEK